MTYQALLDTILELIHWYSTVRRKNTQPVNRELYQAVWKEYDPDALLVRESLIEHVWSLPIIATAIFPYIDDDAVDLGDTLTMLAIHDIWELEVWDEIWFTKQENKEEASAALWFLHPMYHSFYMDVERQKTSTWKFAKSIDKIAPEFLDILCDPQITIARYQQHMNISSDEIVPLKLSHKRKYMERNPYMLWFFEYVCKHCAQQLQWIE